MWSNVGTFENRAVLVVMRSGGAVGWVGAVGGVGKGVAKAYRQPRCKPS